MPDTPLAPWSDTTDMEKTAAVDRALWESFLQARDEMKLAEAKFRQIESVIRDAVGDAYTVTVDGETAARHLVYQRRVQPHDERRDFFQRARTHIN